MEQTLGARLVVLMLGEPKYFDDQKPAFHYHYTNGGYLWKLKEGIKRTHKPWAAGKIPKEQLDVYELYMMDGRKPQPVDHTNAVRDIYQSK